MTDMLVKLYDLPALEPHIHKMAQEEICIRWPNPWEKNSVLNWVEKNFSENWALECEVGFSSTPPTCFIAEKGSEILGFACHDCTRLNYFGPTGVSENNRGKGIGAALLLVCTHQMKTNGYAYCIIGGVGPTEFYNKHVGATVIENSTPGIYQINALKQS